MELGEEIADLSVWGVLIKLEGSIMANDSLSWVPAFAGMTSVLDWLNFSWPHADAQSAPAPAIPKLRKVEGSSWIPRSSRGMTLTWNVSRYSRGPVAYGRIVVKDSRPQHETLWILKPHIAVAEFVAGMIPWACSDSDLPAQPGEPVVPSVNPPPTDNPPVEAGGDVGRLQNNIVKSLSDFCAEPADLDTASASEVVATCGDKTKLAVVGPATTDAAREIALPTELAPAIGAGSPKVAVFPTATYVNPDYEEPSSGEKIALAYVGFTQGLDAADPSKNYFLASGVHSVALGSGETETSILFDTVDASGPGGAGQVTDNTGNGVGVFTPNRPTALFAVQVPVETAAGEEPEFQTRLVVATANPRGEIDGTPILGPGTFQLMTVSNGFAVPADASAFGENSYRLPKAQFDSSGAYVPPPADGSVDAANLSATVFVGDYGLVGGADMGEGNFFLVAQEGESLSLWNAKAEPTANISLGFRPSAQSNVPVIESFKGVAGKYAVLGTADASGRVILLNLDDSSQQPVGVFETGNIQSIALSPDQQYAYVMNADGEVRVLTLADGKVSTQTFEFAKSGGPCLTLAKGLACFTAEGLAFAPFGN
ncbi:MAG: hypothetical protein HYU97_06715 [Deltaproteobacteria bacterium]|nr:hypothetical protein [Deltaproteobacteria bacterium]